MTYRIGFVGNSCTGKTTGMFSVVKLLKTKRTLVGYVADANRFITFPPDRLDDDPNARLNVLFKHLSNETEQLVRHDADYVVSERTAVDWCIYYLWTCANANVDPLFTVTELVNEWMLGYDLLFLMDSHGMAYINDGFRPATTRIRDEVEEQYAHWFDTLRNFFPATCVTITGSDIEDRNLQVERAMEEWLAENGHLIVPESRLKLYKEA